MDENLHYLLHQELDGLFDPPAAAGAGPGEGAPARPVSASLAEPSTGDSASADSAGDEAGPEPTRAERLRDPKLLEALVRLLGLHA